MPVVPLVRSRFLSATDTVVSEVESVHTDLHRLKHKIPVQDVRHILSVSICVNLWPKSLGRHTDIGKRRMPNVQRPIQNLELGTLGPLCFRPG